MSEESINTDDKKKKKIDFYENKKVLQIDDLDINKVLVSSKEPYGKKYAFKYFIGYNDNDVIGPLFARLPQMTGYARKFVEDVTMSFRAKKKQLLKNSNKIWENVEKLVKINFESKPVYGDDNKYINTKIKIYPGSMITNFHDKKSLKEKTPCKCLSIIILDSVIKAFKKYYPQTLSEEWKCAQEKIKMENRVNDNLEKSESVAALMMKQNSILIMMNVTNEFEEILA